MTAWGIESGHVGVAVRQDVAVVTLQRPEKLNALTADMRRELAAVLRHFGSGGRNNDRLVRRTFREPLASIAHNYSHVGVAHVAEQLSGRIR